MMKKWLSLFLAAMMLLALAPGALASSEEYVQNNGDAEADIYAAIGDETPVGKLAVGAQKKLLGTESSGDDTWYRIEGGYVKKAGGVKIVTVLTAELQVSGASVKYGETAKITAQVKDGEGYMIEYSIDGDIWTEIAPTRTEPGKITVKVRATREGEATLTGEGILEVGEKPSGKAKLTAAGGTFPYDGKAHAVTYTLENGDGYTVRFSTDGGETWTAKAPSLTKVGKITVKVEATKSGAETLTAQVDLEVIKAADEGNVVTIVNCKTAVNVREKASSTSKKLGEAKKGKVFKLLAIEGDWYKIQYTASKAGYVFHTYARPGRGTAPTPGPTPVSGEKLTIVNCKTAVNVREKARSTSRKLGEAKKGKVFKLLGTEGNWYRIQYTADQVGYVYRTYGKVGSGAAPTPEPTPVSGEKAYIANCRTAVNVRKKASSNSTKLGTLNRGTEITVIGISGKWTKIAYTGGAAYVFSAYVSYKKPDDDVIGKTATIVNCASFVNVREKANSSSRKLGIAKKGDTYTVKGVSGNWVKVDYGGKAAFIYRRYVKIG